MKEIITPREKKGGYANGKGTSMAFTKLIPNKKKDAKNACFQFFSKEKAITTPIIPLVNNQHNAFIPPSL